MHRCAKRANFPQSDWMRLAAWLKYDEGPGIAPDLGVSSKQSKVAFETSCWPSSVRTAICSDAGPHVLVAIEHAGECDLALQILSAAPAKLGLAYNKRILSLKRVQMPNSAMHANPSSKGMGVG